MVDLPDSTFVIGSRLRILRSDPVAEWGVNEPLTPRSDMDTGQGDRRMHVYVTGEDRAGVARGAVEDRPARIGGEAEAPAALGGGDRHGFE